MVGVGNEGVKPRRSDAIIAFIENLKVPSGIGQGRPLVLRDWQKDFIRNVYDPTDAEGLRLVRRAILSIARKNGKSGLAAALVLVHLVGPEAKRNGEVLSAASDREQAGHIYKMVRQMIELDEELSQMCKCIDTTKRVVCYHLGSFYQALAADARRQHGGNPSFCIYDELAQAPNRELYDVLNTAFGAQEEALFLAISTQSSDPESIMSELCDEALALEAGDLEDDTFYGKVYAVPDDDPSKGEAGKVDIYDERLWYLANPALGDFRSLRDFRALAAKARRSPTTEASFRNLYLNQRVDGVQAFVNRHDWKACEYNPTPEELKLAQWFGGLDLSSRHDLTAFVLAGVLPNGRVLCIPRFWLPEGEGAEESLAERSKRDGAHYEVWRDAGFLQVVPGRVISYEIVAREVFDLIEQHNIQAIAYDRWRINEFKTAVSRMGLDPDKFNLHPHGQSFKDMSPAIEELESLILEHNLAHTGNPVLTYCISNVKVLRDESENRRFDKRKKHKRIDGAVALAMAVAASSRAELPEVKGPSVYEERGILAL